MRATISVMALYTWDSTIFDNMSLPDGVDRDLVRDMCLLDADDYEVIYTAPKWFKIALRAWSKQQMPTWQRQWDVMQVEYNPLHSSYRSEHRHNLETRDLKKSTDGSHEKQYNQNIDRDVETNVDEKRDLNEQIDEQSTVKKDSLEHDEQESDSTGNSTTHGENDAVSHDNSLETTISSATSDRTNRGDVTTQTSTIPYNSNAAEVRQIDNRNDASGYDDSADSNVNVNGTKNGTNNVTTNSTIDDTLSSDTSTDRTLDSTDTLDGGKSTTNTDTINTDTNTTDTSSITHNELISDTVTDADSGTIETDMWFEMNGSGEDNSPQQLLTQEWDFAKLNLYNEIVKAFLFKFCLLVR